MSKKKKILLLFALIITLMVIDFFIVVPCDEDCRPGVGRGYNFGYQTGDTLEIKVGGQLSWERVGYNFRHFSIFWTGPRENKSYANLKEFLTLDGNLVYENLGHLAIFLVFALIMLYFFEMSVWQVLLISVFGNVFHEYVAEGICGDPSFPDLWLDTLGALLGVLLYLVIKKPIWKYQR